ncbi:MAG TPA: hypothetical protein VEV39_00185 [Gemmatimonadales bacterium]|nr:hypothetical protein [Gemmatimonadales bacterium]
MRTRVLTPLEILTSVLYGYLGLALPWNSTFGVVQGLHFATVFVAGIVIGVGAWVRARWVPKAALILAAWVGIPTFASAAGVVRVITEAASPAVGLSFGMVLLGACCQLAVLVIVVRALEIPDAAV